MLAHELMVALAADREREVRDRMRRRGLPSRPTALGRLRDRVAAVLRPRPELPPGRSASRLGRGLGSAVTGASGRAGGTHGQGAC
jgi:hypothetical protein